MAANWSPYFTGIPVNTYHDGGRISFGPDGLLYVATGDAGNPQNAQDLDSLSGKILRITPDGGVPEDNPFQNNPVYSYGHRNVQGLAWDEEGQLFASEFGNNAYDEVNRIVAGGNYGWPVVEGMGGEPEYRDPVAEFPTSEASPSGAEIPKEQRDPAMGRRLLYGGAARRASVAARVSSGRFRYGPRSSCSRTRPAGSGTSLKPPTARCGSLPTTATAAARPAPRTTA